jgi:hypothetical protein
MRFQNKIQLKTRKFKKREYLDLESGPISLSKKTNFIKDVSAPTNYEGRPESKDRLAIKKNKQNKNKKFNILLHM